jgi:hypothetical protein
MDIELFKPHIVQQEIIEKTLKKDTKFSIVVCGRQLGKSFLAENIGLYWALNDPGSKTLYVSPTEAQSSKLYKEILFAIKDIPIIKSKKGQMGSTEIILRNGSALYFRSAASEDSLRGLSIHYMILDEAAFIKRTTVESILLPMMSVTGKKALFLSTPKSRNWLYDYYMKGLNGEKGWVSTHAPSTKSPLVNEELLKMFKDTLSPKLYDQEILAKFVDSASLFNNIDDLFILPPQNKPIINERYVASIDIGLITDASVLSIINENGNVIKIYRWTDIEAPRLIKNIMDVNKEWRFEAIIIESNNQGLPIIQTLNQYIDNVHSFATTSKTKPAMINHLVGLFNTRDILLVKDEDAILEFEMFQFIQSETGHIKFMAQSGFHDDIVMSIAIGMYNYQRYNNGTSTQIFKIGNI